MNRSRHNNILIIIFLFYSVCNALNAEDNPTIEQWKFDLQILLGFSDDNVDGVMGIETFNSLKSFAFNNDLADVVLRGEFEDIERWGFQQYLINREMNLLFDHLHPPRIVFLLLMQLMLVLLF